MPDGSFRHLRHSATSPSRRNAFRLLAGSAVGGLLGFASTADTRFAGKKRTTKPCPKCEGCPDGCESGTEPCGETCRLAFSANQVRNPATCECVPCAAVGEPCSGVRCCSGVCGCGAGCSCRKADCLHPSADCTGLGTFDCCQGVCAGNICN